MHFPIMLWKFHDDLMHTCGSQQKWSGVRCGRPDTLLHQEPAKRDLGRIPIPEPARIAKWRVPVRVETKCFNPRPVRLWRVTNSVGGGAVSPPVISQTIVPISKIQTPFVSLVRALSKHGVRFHLEVTNDVTGQVKVRMFDFSGLVHGLSFLFSWWGGCPTNFGFCHTNFIAFHANLWWILELFGFKMIMLTMGYTMISSF